MKTDERPYGIAPAGGYHHHLGTNTRGKAAPPAVDEARLLDWEIVVPSADDAEAAARSVEAAGYSIEPAGESWLLRDPWGTTLRIVVEP